MQLKFLSKETNEQFISQRESNSDGTTYYIKYNFSLDGKGFTDESKVKEKTYMRFSQSKHQSDEPLRVIYYKNNPEISAIEDPDISFIIFLAFFSVLWNTACYWIFFYTSNKWKKLIRFGKIIDGKLINCNATIGDTDDNNSFDIYGKYNFKSPITGKTITGRFNNQERDDLRPQKKDIGFLKGLMQDYSEFLPKPDTPVKILYLDDKTFEIL